MSVSAMTTFSRRPAAKTTTSAMSSGVRGSTPLGRRVSVDPQCYARKIIHLRIDCVGLGFVAVEPDYREFLMIKLLVSKRSQSHSRKTYSLNLARINLNDPNPRCNKLLPQRFCETPNRSLRSAIYASSSIRFATCYAANIDDVAASAFIAFLEHRQNRLSHVDETGDVCVEHDSHILFGDFGSFGYTFDQAAVVE